MNATSINNCFHSITN